MTILCFVSAFCVLGVLLFVCGARSVWLVRWLYCVLCLSFVCLVFDFPSVLFAGLVGQWLYFLLCRLLCFRCLAFCLGLWLLFCIDDGYSLRYVRCLRCYPLTFPCWCSIVLYRQWLRCALCSVLCFRCRLLCLGCPTCLVGTMAMVRAMSYVFCLWCCFFCY